MNDSFWLLHYCSQMIAISYNFNFSLSVHLYGSQSLNICSKMLLMCNKICAVQMLMYLNILSYNVIIVHECSCKKLYCSKNSNAF